MITVSNIIFDDRFTVADVDKDGKKFDRGCLPQMIVWISANLFLLVSRLTARSANFDMHVSLDLNFELYPLRPDDKFTLVLATSLARGGVGTGTTGDGDDDG